MGLAKTCQCFRPESGVEERTSSTYTLPHQRTPEVLILQPCRVGVEVLHVQPRRKEACDFVGSEQNRPQDCEI